MEIARVADTEPGENPHGVETKKIYDHENALGVHILMMPGERLRRHITPVDVIIYYFIKYEHHDMFLERSNKHVTEFNELS